jgi:hypothetical protein
MQACKTSTDNGILCYGVERYDGAPVNSRFTARLMGGTNVQIQGHSIRAYIGCPSPPPEPPSPPPV